jgi:hypothetical protein
MDAAAAHVAVSLAATIVSLLAPGRLFRPHMQLRRLEE